MAASCKATPISSLFVGFIPPKILGLTRSSVLGICILSFYGRTAAKRQELQQCVTDWGEQYSTNVQSKGKHNIRSQSIFQ